MKGKQKIIDFLEANGWVCREIDDFMHFHKNDSVGVDVGEDEIVFIGESGDFADIPLNYYALVGFIYVHRLITPVIPSKPKSRIKSIDDIDFGDILTNTIKI